MRRALTFLAAATLAGVAAGCSDPSAAQAGDASTTASSSTTLTVFAAASLRNTFSALGQQFEAGHPGVQVAFNFAGSADLVAQLQQGAPADVFASADPKNMDRAVRDDLVSGTPKIFAANTLAIAVPPDNPAGVASFQDLTKPGVELVVCAPGVPCGSAVQKLETATGIDLKPVSEESAVTDVVNKVRTGEADAGLVYLTDVKSSDGEVKGIAFPESKEAVNLYPIAPLAASQNADLSREFVDLVTGSEGQSVLADAGFARP